MVAQLDISFVLVFRAGVVGVGVVEWWGWGWGFGVVVGGCGGGGVVYCG